ncbi:MAG: hypothetical protein R6V31_07630 [Halohasta sp.]
MWSSTLPTGTVRDEGRGSRTYPQAAHQPARPQGTDCRSRAALAAEVGRLREEKRQADAEIERLESQVALLRTQLERHHESKRAMVDRYERVIAELETAAATTPTAEPTTAEPSTRGLLDRLRGLF